MVGRRTLHNVIWIDVENPNQDEIREIMDETGLAPHFCTDLTSPSPQSFTASDKTTLKVAFDYPVVKRPDIDYSHDVKAIATKTHLITIRYEDIEAIDRFGREIEVHNLLQDAGKKATGGHLLMAFLHTLYDALHSKLDYLETKLIDIENEIFQEHERAMVFEISKVGRRVINFKHVLLTHERILEDLEIAINTTFPKKFKKDVHHLLHKYEVLFRRINAVRATLDELRDTNTALLTTKQNEIMKTLTIMAFITFPLTLFTSLFGMNTHTTPILGQPGDFWVIVGIMIVVSIGFFGYFKYKKWM